MSKRYERGTRCQGSPQLARVATDNRQTKYHKIRRCHRHKDEIATAVNAVCILRQTYLVIVVAEQETMNMHCKIRTHKKHHR
ncbi:hypothetical protein L914_17235, partial [Phytophthora nicotianae]